MLATIPEPLHKIFLSLQWLRTMPQVEFALGTADCTAKV